MSILLSLVLPCSLSLPEGMDHDEIRRFCILSSPLRAGDEKVILASSSTTVAIPSI